MLPSYSRLNLAHTDQSEKSIKVSDKNLVLVYRENPGKFKAAAIVSKKVAKLAVDRNRIKRIIIEAIGEISMLEGEYIVIAKNNIKEEKSTNIKTQLENLIKKIK